MSSIQTKTKPNQSNQLVISFNSPEMAKVAKAISSKTRRLILTILNEKALDVSRISKEIGQTEANISAQIKILQKANLVKCKYEPGGHGVRKICFNAYDKIEIELF